MTDIDTMSIDDLRIAVARELMGWSEISSRRSADGTLTGVITTNGRWIVDDIPDYPRDIAAAWLVVEKMRERYAVTLDDELRSLGPWEFEIFCSGHKTIAQGHGKTAPEAICRAALKVVRNNDA